MGFGGGNVQYSTDTPRISIPVRVRVGHLPRVHRLGGAQSGARTVRITPQKPLPLSTCRIPKNPRC